MPRAPVFPVGQQTYRCFLRPEYMTAVFSSAPHHMRLIGLLATLCVGALPAQSAFAQQAPSSAAVRSDVAAQPGDKVLLKIYREPDLSGEFVVPESGQVDFPKIGSVRVDRISTDSLRSLLIAQYARSLRDPAIEVTVLRRVNVIGAVRNPGFYYADPTVTVKGALALAGGVVPDGNRNKVELLRGNKRTAIQLSSEPSLADSPVQSGDQVSAPEKSWFSRNTALVVSGITGIALVVVTIIRP
ncbi:MAG TPA: polysaccharide biosynthesis/export family protein [Gemmatimonadaceae bacterium]|nr:polysaccharide biosynthesis/export family protein [Gemmatimonadaceae bacterium]